MPEQKEKILDRLRKLIGHEKSAREIGSLAEADAFASKIAELCDRHRIALAEVPEAERSADINTSFWEPREAGLERRQRQSPWQRRMAAGVALGHFCEFLFWKGMNNIVFVGTSTDVEVAAAMMTILCRAAVKSCDQARQRSKIVPKDFLFGFAAAVALRYRDQRDRQEAQHNGATQALVRQTDQLIREHVVNIGAQKGKPLKAPEYNASMQAGYDAGMAADLDTKLVKEGSHAKQLGT